MRLRNVGLLLCAGSLVWISGCGLFEDEAVLPPGSFVMEVTGDVDETIEGAALYRSTTIPFEGQPHVLLYLQTAEQGYVELSLPTEWPETGTYTFRDADADTVWPLAPDVFTAGGELRFQNGHGYVLDMTAGELTITRAKPASVAGEVILQATGRIEGPALSPPVEVTLRGTFNATNSDS